MEGYFPDELKIAEMIAIFKEGDREDANNYRPISILTVISKIFEKHLYNELTTYAENNNLISPHQWGFTRGVSTDVAIAKLMEKVYGGLNEGQFGVGVFLDLEKAFDLVDRSILVEKLKVYGVLGTEITLFTSFLANRKNVYRKL